MCQAVLRGHLVALAVRGAAHRCDALHHDEPTPVGVPVLPGVVGDRDVRVRGDPLELPAEAQRARERDGPRVAVAHPQGSDAVQRHTTFRRRRPDRDDQVTRQDLVDLIGPCDGPVCVVCHGLFSCVRTGR
jgi:hypothetical protein